jgi:type IV pilus assembly protein PilM
MARNVLSNVLRLEFAPPRYLSMPAAGFAVSASGVKAVVIRERPHGLELAAFGEERLPLEAISGGEYTDRAAILAAVRTLARRLDIRFANIALPEARSYLFETSVEGGTRDAWHASIAPRIDQLVPLPPSDVAFDVVPVTGASSVVGVGYASRVIEEALSVFDEAGVGVHAAEGEMFALVRSLLRAGDPRTVLIVDVGRTTTKLCIAQERTPRFATTLDIGGHALTLAVQKHFAVTEDEARRIKREQGIVAGPESAEYQAAMLSTVSAMRDEIMRRLEYWQSHATAGSGRSPITHVILAGGNASVRGLAEHFESSIGLPVALGDVFANFAPREHWLPPLPYEESLGYATAIGLALRDYDA